MAVKTTAILSTAAVKVGSRKLYLSQVESVVDSHEHHHSILDLDGSIAINITHVATGYCFLDSDFIRSLCCTFVCELVAVSCLDVVLKAFHSDIFGIYRCRILVVDVRHLLSVPLSLTLDSVVHLGFLDAYVVSHCCRYNQVASCKCVIYRTVVDIQRHGIHGCHGHLA